MRRQNANGGNDDFYQAHASPVRPLVTFADIENPDDPLLVIHIVKDPVVSDFEAVLGGVLINDKRGFDLGFAGGTRLIGQALDAFHNFILSATNSSDGSAVISGGNLGRDHFQSLVKFLLNGFRRKANAVFQGLNPSPPEDGFVLRRRLRGSTVAHHPELAEWAQDQIHAAT